MDIKKLINIPVFANLPMEKLDEFLKTASHWITEYETRDYIARQGTPCRGVYFLYEGQVRALMTGTDGKQLTLEDHDAPMILASNFVFATDTRFPVDIIATRPCRVMIMEKDAFTRLMKHEPVVLDNFLRILSDRSHNLARKLGSLVLQKLKNRVAAYLLEQGEIRNQKEVAERMGVARPSLARILAELSHEGAVIFEKRRISISDRAQLEKYV